MQRAVGVRTQTGDLVAGTVTLGPREIEWRFTPQAAWKSGSYDLVVQSILEDVAGNRVGRAFEVDEFKKVDSSATTEVHKLPFRIR